MITRRMLLPLVAALALTACAAPEDEATDDAETSAEEEVTSAEESTAADEDSSEEEAEPSESAAEEESTADDGDDGIADADQVEDWQTALALEGARSVFEAAEGLRFEVLDVQLNDVPNAPEDVTSEIEPFFDDGLAPVLGVQARVVNETDGDVEWFATQSTIVVNGQSIEPDLFFSDSMPMDGLLAGTSAEVGIQYVLPADTDLEALATASDVRIVGSGPVDPESFDTIGEDIDMTVSWSPES